MSRKLTPKSSLDNLKREAKQWLKALRSNDPRARARFEQAHPKPPQQPALRDVQHALAREYDFAGWKELCGELQRLTAATSQGRDALLTQLLSAAVRGNVDQVRETLDANPELLDQRGELDGHTGKRTALHFAMNSMKEDLVTLLLERGADPNIRDDGDNAMPLHFAAERGNMALVRLLVEHGADPNGEGDTHELGILGWATCFPGLMHHEVAEYLLAHGAPHNIFTATSLGALDAIRQIAASSPAELNRRMDGTNHRRRPLHLAILKKQPASLAILLELGADAESTDVAGLTPLDQAALNGEHEMVHLLRAHGAAIGLPAAIALNLTDDIERLLAAEPNALRPGGSWERIIIRAAERSSAGTIRALVKHGASVHTRDNPKTAVDDAHGYTALHAAAFNGNEPAVRELLRLGASATDRDSKYWGTPAGWANYAGHPEIRDILLEARADIFDAIDFDRLDLARRLLEEDPRSLDRRFGEYTSGLTRPNEWLDPAWPPIAAAVFNGKTDAIRLLLDRGADVTVKDSKGRSLVEIANARGHGDIAELLARQEPRRRSWQQRSFEERAALFLERACLDWRADGSQRTRRMNDAGRILAHEPEIAGANIYTAVACADLGAVRQFLARDSQAASTPGGPRRWPPLLYLCAARLPQTSASAQSVEVARLLLDNGADPNAFYLGGNADIHYTALSCVLGRGEEQASMHPRARELTRLLLEGGANARDTQVFYNVFADHASRPHLNNEIVWLLELIQEFSTRHHKSTGWDDQSWTMFDLFGAPSLGDGERKHNGAYFMLSAAVDRNLIGLAEWILAHGANPETPPGNLYEHMRSDSLYAIAVSRGFKEMAQLLRKYGAKPDLPEPDDHERYLQACMAMDREQVQRFVRAHPEYLNDHRVLFAAVSRDRADVVEMLLDFGVSPDVENHEDGRGRALHLAAYVNALKSARLLIERGAEVDFREERHQAIPLGVAAWAQRREMIELLGRYSRDVWDLTYTGRVDRLREVLAESPELARVVGSSGDTPLMWLPDDADAALQAAQLLMENGADASCRSAQGLSAADIAAERGLEAVAEFLRSRGG